MKTTYEELPSTLFEYVSAAAFSKPNLLLFNKKLAGELQLQFENATDEQLAKIFCGQESFFESKPLALAYAGHQFGHFVHQLGDGRALLIGQAQSTESTFDIQLKGSGPTPFSRKGDGFSALGPVVREFIVSEAMHSLGVPTTRSLAVVKTGDSVHREETQDGGVLTRVAKSHIRVGTFEYLYVREDFDSLKKLADHVIEKHYPHCAKKDSPYLSLLASVADEQLRLVSKWMVLGFIHGVMNTDNMSIIGETIDFGPCAFMDEFNFDQVFSFIDRDGRYAYANQGSIALWNISVFGNCLWPLLGEDQEKAVEAVKSVLEPLPEIFVEHWLRAMALKFGIRDPEKNDIEIVQSFLGYLEDKKLDFTQSFRGLIDLVDQDEFGAFEDTDEFREFFVQWKLRLKLLGQDSALVKETMAQANPVIIPRNHFVEKAIQQAYKGDISFAGELIEALKSPYSESLKGSQWDQLPTDSERVTQTFCGT